jgi:FixJ family two-component response regulator
VDVVPPTIYVIDDDPDVCRALGQLLRAGGHRPLLFHSGIDFLRAHAPALAGCVLLDEVMPDLDGLGLQAILKETDFCHPIIFITGLATIQMTVRAIKAGAVNVLTKPVDASSLLKAIEEALRIDAEWAHERREHQRIVARVATLTAREREVLEHVVSGRMNKQIAGDLGTVEKTIKAHRARIMQKMHVRSLASLVRIANTVGIGPELTQLTGINPQELTRFPDG